MTSMVPTACENTCRWQRPLARQVRSISPRIAQLVTPLLRIGAVSALQFGFLFSLAFGVLVPGNRVCLAATDPPPRDEPARASSMRELLEVAGVDASHLRNLTDGQPIALDGEETLLRILHRFPDFPLDLLRQWCGKETDWPLLSQDPPAHRAKLFRIEGRTESVRRVQLAAEISERLEFDHYYQVTMALGPNRQPALLCTRTVPKSWPRQGPLSQRVGAIGLFLKAGVERGSKAELVFAASRVMWFPEQEDLKLGVSASQVALAKAGMDIGLLDDLRSTERQPLSARDRECFYQLLHAVGQSSFASLDPSTPQITDVARLLTSPASLRGEIFSLRGTVRRITRIEVDSPEIVQRFGIRHYFQLDVFVPLDNEVIKLGEPKSGRESPVFANRFPVTVCVRRLPAGLPAAQSLQEEIALPAVFCKLWTFRSQYISSLDRDQLQLAPLFVGREPRVAELVSPLPARIDGRMLVVLFVVLLLGGYALWRWQSADARGHRRIVERWRGGEGEPP